MNIKFAHRMKDYEAGIFQVLNEKKDEAERQGRTIYFRPRRMWWKRW